MVRFVGLFLLLTAAIAFTTPQAPSRVPTQLFESKPTEIPYGEESRKYRRTVYTHDDWVNHRSTDRFVRNILTTTNSGIYKNVGREVAVATGISTFIFLWNMLASGYTDLAGVSQPGALSDLLPALSLPLTPFTLASPSLGLLLGKCYST